MATILALVDLAGSIALLLWGVHMVRSGIERAFGSDLRRLLGVALGNRVKAFGAGLGVTALLQSSTVTGLMIASFTASGLVDLVPALGGTLGANVGTTSLDTEEMRAEDQRRVFQILAFITNIEQAGDLVENGIVRATNRMQKRRLAFSPQGRADLHAMLLRLQATLQSAAAIFMTEDARPARQLASRRPPIRC